MVQGKRGLGRIALGQAKAFRAGAAPGEGSGAYSDIDMVFSPAGYATRAGRPYPATRIK